MTNQEFYDRIGESYRAFAKVITDNCEDVTEPESIDCIISGVLPNLFDESDMSSLRAAIKKNDCQAVITAAENLKGKATVYCINTLSDCLKALINQMKTTQQSADPSLLAAVEDSYDIMHKTLAEFLDEKADIPFVSGKEKNLGIEEIYNSDTPGLKPGVTYGDAVVLNLNEKKLHKVIVNHRGYFENFPGIISTGWEEDMNLKYYYIIGEIRFRTEFETRSDGYRCLWQVQPDGMYWEDDDGFGGTNDVEIILFADMDERGNFITKFQPYSINGKIVENAEKIT